MPTVTLSYELQMVPNAKPIPGAALKHTHRRIGTGYKTIKRYFGRLFRKVERRFPRKLNNEKTTDSRNTLFMRIKGVFFMFD